MQIRTFALLVATLALISPPRYTSALGDPATRKSAVDSTYTPDVDLKTAPEFYRKRVIAFRNLLRREGTRAKQVQKAIELVQTKKSPYRQDAIDFLSEVRAPEAVPVLIRAAVDPDVREFSLYALAVFNDLRAIPTLIRYLRDDRENVRGNAQQSLEKITRMNFSYRYSDSPKDRAVALREIETWWERAGPTFKPHQETPQEKTAAEEAWEKYGKMYLHDLGR